MDREGTSLPPAGAAWCDRYCFPHAVTTQLLRRPVPPSAEPSAAWLTSALQHGCGTGGSESPLLDQRDTVATVQLHEITQRDPEDGSELLNGGGKSGTRLVRLVADTTAGRKLQLVHKLTETDAVTDIPWPERAMAWLLFGFRIDVNQRQEAVFYRDAAPVLRQLSVPLPRVFHVGIEGSHSPWSCCYLCCCFTACCCTSAGVTTRTSVVQEDLGQRGFATIHVMSAETMPLDVLTTSLRLLARLHRWGWKGEQAASTHREQPSSGWEQLITGQVPAMHRYIKSFATDVSKPSAFICTCSTVPLYACGCFLLNQLA